MYRLALVLIAVALTGCDRTATTHARYGVVTLHARDYRYDHQNVRVRAGLVTFKLFNDGRDETNLRIRRDDLDVASIATLEPGAYGTTTVELDPGEYIMTATVGRHETLGEYGTLVVTRR